MSPRPRPGDRKSRATAVPRRWDHRQVDHPQLVRRRCHEVLVDQVRGKRGFGTAACGALPSEAGAHDVGLAHQTFNLPAAAWTPSRLRTARVHARRTVVAAGLRVDLLDPLGRFDVVAAPFARLLLRAAPPVVGGGSDVQLPQDALGSPAGMLVDERRRLSWAFSLRGATSSARSSMVSRPSRSPASASALQIRLRRASMCTPRSTASFLTYGFGSVVRYIRTALSRNSNEYFLGTAMVDVPLMRTICPRHPLHISGKNLTWQGGEIAARRGWPAPRSSVRRAGGFRPSPRHRPSR